MKPETHIDGTWLTSEYFYQGHKILLKSRKGKGFKAHIFKFQDSSKVEKTIRYSFILPEELKQEVKKYIDFQRGQRLIIENSKYGKNGQRIRKISTEQDQKA